MRKSVRFISMLTIVHLALGMAFAQQPGRRGGFVPPLWAALDADKDGTLSAKELENAGAALKSLDRNKDGKIERGEAGMRSGRRPASSAAVTDSMFEENTHARTDEEKKILAVLDDLDKNQRRGNMNVPVEDGKLLRLLTEMLGAKHVVEIGTSNGYSGIWLCLALRATGGKLTTYEIDARRAKMARDNFKRAGVDHLVTLVEGDAHKEAPKLKGPIDLLFLDADKEGYIDYLNKLVPLLKPGGVIVAHNMNTRQADAKFVKHITSDKNLETIFVHMDHAGVAISLKKR